MSAKPAAHCPVCTSYLSMTMQPHHGGRFYRHKRPWAQRRWQDGGSEPFCPASHKTMAEAQAILEASKLHMCHRCGRAFHLYDGKFPRHNRAAMHDRKRGGQYLWVIPGTHCAGSKQRPQWTRDWWGHDWKDMVLCTCEERYQQLTDAERALCDANPLEAQFLLWGSHGRPEPPEKEGPADMPYTIRVDGEELHVDAVEPDTNQAMAFFDPEPAWEPEDEEVHSLRLAQAALERQMERLSEAHNTITGLIVGRENMP